MTQYDISDISNYLEEYNVSPSEIFERYTQVITEFINHSHDSVTVSNIEYYKHIIIKGIETITHVFRLLLLYTRNIELVIYNIKKSVYYFIEFIGQIGDDNNDFLKLTSIDAMLFVYKKTIFEIDNTKRTEYEKMNNDKMVDIVFSLTELYMSSLRTSIKLHIHNTKHESNNAFDDIRDYRNALISITFKHKNTDILNSSLETMLVFSDTLRSLSTGSPFKALEAMCKKLEKYSINKEDIYKNVLDNIENFDIMTAKRFVNLLTFSSKSIYIQ